MGKREKQYHRDDFLGRFPCSYFLISFSFFFSSLHHFSVLFLWYFCFFAVELVEISHNSTIVIHIATRCCRVKAVLLGFKMHLVHPSTPLQMLAADVMKTLTLIFFLDVK